MSQDDFRDFEADLRGLHPSAAPDDLMQRLRAAIPRANLAGSQPSRLLFWPSAPPGGGPRSWFGGWCQLPR